jgi:tight adherence protein B
MKLVMSAFLAAAIYLAWGPLPVMRERQLWQLVREKASRLPKFWRKSQEVSLLPLLWTLHGEVMAGCMIDDALLRACTVMPAGTVTATYRALQEDGDAAVGLETDAQLSKLAVLTDVALIYRICSRTGSPITKSLMRIIHSVQDNQKRQRTLAQETASTKATVLVLAALPVFGVLMGLGLGLNPLTWVVHSALGGLCAAGGVGLEVLGWLWVRLLIRRASPQT